MKRTLSFREVFIDIQLDYYCHQEKLYCLYLEEVASMPGKEFEIEKIMDSLATISSIIFHRLHCMECNQCEPCSPVFMEALGVLRDAGHP